MILEHTLDLFTHPDKAWQDIRKEHPDTKKLYLRHILILALIPVGAAYYGTTQVGWSIAGGEPVRLTPESAASLCALAYMAILAGIYILGRFIDFLAGTYGVDGKEHRGIELAAYTATPLLIIGAILLYPHLWINMFAGLIGMTYALYLLYEGLPILMNIPPERGFMFASSVLTVGLVMLVGLLGITVIVWSVGIGPVYVSH